MINRPPGPLPIHTEFWNDMPHGQDWTPPATPAQPVHEIHFKEVKGHTSKQTTKVVEYLYASVDAAHLRTGTATNAAVRRWVQQEVGRPNDDAGHIIGSNQGGLGTVFWNIFPQNSNFNRGVFNQEVEKLIHDAVVTGPGSVRIWFRFVYGDVAVPGRPTEFWFYILFPNGQRIINDLINP